ncbi:hypothetical protein LQT91_25425 (plasmid) [Escherichia coli]|nr:hypothetical protein LQT40_01165 [Escherichia coli]UGH34454.1 hypothetical protein LQT91_25425 [Escherichia coli]
MAFIWNDESLAILRENAGILTTEQIAQLLHTNITAVRNMAYRLKLSLRVTAYNHRRIAQVQALYASETLSLKEIAAKTGLTASTVQYIVYVKSKISPTPPRNMSLLKRRTPFITACKKNLSIRNVPCWTTSLITRDFVNCI